jgi:intein-encoded DNA endonuclease-like protein
MSAKNVLKQFEKIDTEEKAYWLGFLYADGSVGSTESKVELSLAEKDFHHIEKFKEFMGINNKIAYRDKAKAYRISFRSDSCKQDLIKQGCIPKKSLILKFPTKQQVPFYLIRHFIRGYFDGDGWFTNTDSCFQIGLIGTVDFIKGFLDTVDNININTQNKIFTVHREDGAKRYVFGAINDVTNFLNWIYKDANIYLDRKYELYLDFLNNGSKYHKTK